MANPPKAKKWYVYADVSCVDSGSMADREELLESFEIAKERFAECLEEMQSHVGHDTAIIDGDAESYTFESGYLVMAALIEVPGSIKTAKKASQWITAKVSKDISLEDHLKLFKGFYEKSNSTKSLESESLWEKFC